MTTTMRVGFVELPAQYEDISQDILELVKETMKKGAFVGGALLSDFESSLAEYVGVEYAVGCSDGTLSLALALIGAGLEKGDKVIVPANSYIASANAVVHAGGAPVFVDCDPNTYLLDLDQTETALKKRKAKFIMPVHLYGNPCPMHDILEVAERYNAIVIEDNAQALGATIKKKKTGTFGSASGVSFYPAKNLGSFGQGGAVLTNNKLIAETVRMFREQGQGSVKYYHDVIGYNGRLHSLQAGILNMLLKKLDGFNEARNRAAQSYAERIDSRRLQKTNPHGLNVYHLFEYRCDSNEMRDRLADRLKAADIGFGYHYPVPIHKQKAYAESNNIHLPVSERLADTLISLPMHPGLKEEQVAYICEVINKVE